MITLVVLLAAAAFVPTFKAERRHAVDDTFLDDVDSVIGAGGAGEALPGRAPARRSRSSRPSDAEADAGGGRATRAVDGVVIGLVRPSPARALPPKVVDGHVLVQATLTGAADSPEAEDDGRASCAPTSTRSSPDVLVGGSTAINLDVREASERDLGSSSRRSCAVIFVVLMLLLRSFVAPLLLVLANVLSFAATIGVAALVFNHVFDFPGSRPVDRRSTASCSSWRSASTTRSS